MRRKIINCNHNCENILFLFAVSSSPPFLDTRKTLFLRNISSDFPPFPLTLCFHQSTNENMCVFFCRKLFSLEEKKEKRDEDEGKEKESRNVPRLQEFFGTQAREISEKYF